MYNSTFNYGNNPYYGGYIPPIQQQMYRQALGLQGKTIDNLDAVKSADIPLDGSISYFALADGSAIATKNIQPDGTSKIVIFKPVKGEQVEPKYVTIEEFKKVVDNLNADELDDIKEDIKEIKKQLKKRGE